MIIRAWRGRASPAKRSAYPAHFKDNVLPELQSIKGFLGALLLQQDRADVVEFLVLTRWETVDAIRAFAGDDITRAMVEPEAVAALISFDQTVQHYDVVHEVAR
jgi:heme-degrading monooxygenase HmoA